MSDKAAVVLPPLEVIPAKRGPGRPPKNNIIANVHQLSDSELAGLAKEASSRARSSMALWTYLKLDMLKEELEALVKKGKREDKERLDLIKYLLDKFMPAAPKEEGASVSRPVNILISNVPGRGRQTTPVADHTPARIDHMQDNPTVIEVDA